MLLFYLFKFCFGKPPLLNHQLELVDRNRLVVDKRHDVRSFELPHLNVDNREPLFLYFLIQGLKKAVRLALIGFRNFLFHIDVFLALEQLRNFFLQRIDQPFDIAFEC